MEAHALEIELSEILLKVSIVLLNDEVENLLVYESLTVTKRIICVPICRDSRC